MLCDKKPAKLKESLPHSYEASHVTWHGLLATKKQLWTKMSVAE